MKQENPANSTQISNDAVATEKMQQLKPLPRRKKANPFNDSNFVSTPKDKPNEPL